VPPSRCDPLNDRTSPQPFRAAILDAIHSTTRHRHVHHLRATIFAVHYRQRRARHHGAPRTVRGPPRTSQRDVVNSAPGAPLQGAKGTPNIIPPGTAGVRRLPLAVTAAREAQLHVVPTAQPRVSRPHTLQTAVDRAAAWSSHSRNLQVTL